MDPRLAAEVRPAADLDVMREVEHFLIGVQEELDAHRADLCTAVAAGVGYTLRMAAENPLLKSVVVSSRANCWRT